MPVGRPRSGTLTLRIPVWLHEELAAEAYDRNVSINQLCFEGLVMRRQLIKKPEGERTLSRLDGSRTRRRRIIQRELSKSVARVAVAAPNQPPLDEVNRRIVAVLKERRKPVTVDEIAHSVEQPGLTVAGRLLMLDLQ